MPAGGAITIAVAVTTSSAVGDHYASGGGQTPGYSPWVNGTTGAHIATELAVRRDDLHDQRAPRAMTS